MAEVRVAAIKAQAQRMIEDWHHSQIGSKPSMIATITDLLTVVDVQATRLAVVEQEAVDAGAIIAEYARHKIGCSFGTGLDGEGDCTCGFSAFVDKVMSAAPAARDGQDDLG